MQVRQVPMVSDKHRETICLRMRQTLYVWTVPCIFAITQVCFVKITHTTFIDNHIFTIYSIYGLHTFLM
jgi:hypothetical protein